MLYKWSVWEFWLLISNKSAFEHLDALSSLKTGLPCVGAGRLILCFCSQLFLHFVPAEAEWRRPAVERHEVKREDIKQLQSFYTGGLDPHQGKGWQCLEKVICLKCCQSCVPRHVYHLWFKSRSFFQYLTLVNSKKIFATHQKELFEVLLYVFVLNSEHGNSQLVDTCG